MEQINNFPYIKELKIGVESMEKYVKQLTDESYVLKSLKTKIINEVFEIFNIAIVNVNEGMTV